MSIKNVKIQNFTVFENIEADFASGINVLIGENGTGKTHLVKLIYTILLDPIAKSINEYFKVKNRTDLFNNIERDTQITVGINRYSCKLSFPTNKRDSEKAQQYDSIKIREDMVIKHPEDVPSGTFILAKDMLTHSKGFLSMYDKFDMPFDKTYYDIISKSLLPNLKEVPQIGLSILPKLEKIIGGKVVVENDTFYIHKNNGDIIEFSVEAEGIKKIATLWQLIMNESITKGTVLFWDEPEANINPSLASDVVEILLELSRQGVQIFLATHDYIFAKYIEVLMKESDDVSFHALYKTENEGVKCETKRKFSLLSHNAMREENINLYDAEMKKEEELW